MAEQTIARPAPRADQRAAKGGWGLWILGGVAALALLGGAAYYYGFGAKTGHAAENADGSNGGGGGDRTTSVVVQTPTPHGIEKVVDQPGSVEAFKWADLYAKVSGYLDQQSVDIGSRVKEGQVLAVIRDPEIVKARDQAKAAADQADAAIKQADARIKTAKAVLRTSQASVATAKAEQERRKSSLEYRQKQFSRISGLVQRHAVEQQLEDEERDKYDAATADLHAAEAGVQSAQATVSEAEAKVEQAQADLVEAKANAEAAQAALAKAEELVKYTKIVAPYDGVVTARNFHPGAFIRSASDGNEKPLLSVARTDKMRVVVRVPDTAVPDIDIGDPATLELTNLPGRLFKEKVSRFSYLEDVANRTMRTEIDVPNPDDLLRAGMYGNVRIVARPAAKDHMTIPSTGVFEGSGGKGFVYVVRGGKAHKTPVTIVEDNGINAEISQGLKHDDQVVIKYNGAMSDGVAVTSETAPALAAGPEKAEH